MSNTEKLARDWADSMQLKKEYGAPLSPRQEAAMAHILATTQPPEPLTMADVKWDHDEHFLVEADGGEGLKVAMLGMREGDLYAMVVNPGDIHDYQAGDVCYNFSPRYFTPTGRKFKLVPDEPEPLPEPKDCKPGECYLVQLSDRIVVAAERRHPEANYPWQTLISCYEDSEVTLLARLIPDREVPND